MAQGGIKKLALGACVRARTLSHCCFIMEQAWRYRGRTITGDDLGLIRELIAAHPAAGRCELSRLLCEAWDWKQSNGALRDMVCRGLLLMLDRGGQILLPPMRSCPPNPLLLRARPEPVVPDNRPVRGALQELLPLKIEQVRRSKEELLFNSLMEQYHYLRYEQPVGEHLKYLVKTRGQAIACLAWSSAPRHLGSRDRFIGWDQRHGAAQPPLHRLQHALSDSAVGARAAPCLAYSGADGAPSAARLGADVCSSPSSAGDLRRSAAVRRNLLSGGELGRGGRNHRAGARIHKAEAAEPVYQAGAGAAASPAVQRQLLSQ